MSDVQPQEQQEKTATEAQPVKAAVPSEAKDANAESDKPKDNKAWYILKVQVNREDAIRESLKRRVAIAGLDRYFGDTLVPTEKVTEIRGDKKKIVKRKLYPGYIMIYMEVTEETWFLVRETPGIGDFTGASGKPTPMLPHEVERILASERSDATEAPKLKVGYKIGDQVKIKAGPFETQEGVVDAIDYTSGRVTVSINMFGRSTPIELEYWQIEPPT